MPLRFGTAAQFYRVVFNVTHYLQLYCQGVIARCSGLVPFSKSDSANLSLVCVTPEAPSSTVIVVNRFMQQPDAPAIDAEGFPPPLPSRPCGGSVPLWVANLHR